MTKLRRYLVDGNNLLFATRELEPPDRPLGRFMLVQLIGRWAEGCDQTVEVVFDGPQPSPNIVRQLSHHAVTLAFSGRRPADDVIAERLQADTGPRVVGVVSNDREVQAAARRRKATPVRADVFWRMVRRSLARANAPSEAEEKPGDLSAAETEAWLREFGYRPKSPPS